MSGGLARLSIVLVLGATAGCERETHERPAAPAPTTPVVASVAPVVAPAAPSVASASQDAGCVPEHGGPSGCRRPAEEPEVVLWEGRSAGFRVRWTSRDITAQRSEHGATEFSLKERLRVRFTAMQERASEGDDVVANPCTTEVKARLLSLVGSLLSYEEQSYTSCLDEAHPAGETRWLAVDLGAKPSKAVELSTLFSEEALSREIGDDELVRVGIDDKTPRPLADLVDALADSPPVAAGGHCYSFPENLLERFGFHHLEKGRVFVRLGLPGAGPCRYELTQMGLALAVPPRLRRALDDARAHRGGVLMDETEKERRRTKWRSP